MNCPKCGCTELWDNRQSKTNPKAPDYKCKNKACDGAIWPDKKPAGNVAAAATKIVQQAAVQSLDLVEYGEELPTARKFKEAMEAKPNAPPFSRLDSLLHTYAICLEEARGLMLPGEDVTAIACALFAEMVKPIGK